MNVSGNLHKLFHHFFIWTFNDRVKGHPKGHDYGHHFLCWLSGVVPFNTWLISSWEEKKLLLKADQLTKWQLFSLKVTTLTISSEIDVILCICSACNNIYSFFSTWDKSCVKWDNSWNSTQKMRYISPKMVEVVILSENSCHFVRCSACNNSYFLLSLK